VDINAIATFLLNNLFNQVALLVGIFVAIGLLAQGKGARLTIEGTVRAALGYERTRSPDSCRHQDPPWR